MSFDPYQTLGVERDATSNHIKRAYRAKAKKAHPDAGGSTEEFQKLARSQLVLLDPVRRARFDRDGTIDTDSADNAVANATGMIVGLLAQIAERNENACQADLVAEARKYFKQQIGGFVEAKREIVKKQDRLRKIAGRMKRRLAGPAPLVDALLHQARAYGEPLITIERNMQAVQDAIKILEDYEFEVQVTPRPTSYGFPHALYPTRGTLT